MVLKSMNMKTENQRENQWNQNLFFEKSTKIGKDTQAKKSLTKAKKMIQINKVRNEWGGISNSLTEIQKVIRKYLNLLYVSKLNSLDEMDTFIQIYLLLRDITKVENL